MRLGISVVGLLLSVVCAFAPRAAIGVTITFDNLPGMPNSPGSAIPPGSQLSDAYAYLGVTFSSGAPYVAVVNLGPGHATSSPNGIGGSRPNGTLTYDASYPIVAVFVDPGNPSLKAVTDFVSVRTDLLGSGKNVTLNAYGPDGGLIDSTTVVDSGGPTLSISKPGIHSVQFIGTTDSDGAALDDFEFDPVVSFNRAPVLSSLALPVVALLLLGGGVVVLNRRRTRHA